MPYLNSPSAGFQIPDVIDPPNTVCVQMLAPDDPIHLANLIGALHELAFGPAWQDDDAHSAKQLVQVWRRYLSTLTINNCPVPLPPLHGGIDEDDQMPLRVDCDCNVFVTCCDGSEKQLLTSDQVKALIAAQPGTGAPQPQPGKCQDYSGTLQAAGRFLLPTVVNPGDTITVLNSVGLTNDNAEVPWRDYAGNQVLAGINLGGQFTQTTDRLNTAFHDALLVLLAGTYYPAYTPVTVPGGLTNVQPVLILNTSPGEDIAGSLDLTIEVCNNQAGTWSHTFDFTVDSQGWTLSPVPPGDTGTAGIYNPGVGWESAYVQAGSSEGYNFIQILSPSVPANTLTSISVQFIGSQGTINTTTLQHGLYSFNGGSLTVARADAASPLPASPYAAGSFTQPFTQAGFDLVAGEQHGVGDPGGLITVTKVILTGIGADPF